MIANETKPTEYIVLEFNELCPDMMAGFLERGLLPNFKSLHDQSVVMVTDADEEAPELEPWIQWLTIHSGMSAKRHGIFNLGDGKKLEEKCVAEILSDHGISVGIFGSMNTNYRHINGFLVPDPWDVDGQAEPDDLQPFFRVVSSQVQDSSKAEGLSKSEMARFGWFLLRHGLQMSTMRSALGQLWSERGDRRLNWRRPMILEELQFDIYRFLRRRINVRFSTFFCNSTAHFQHYYWRNMHPDIFAVPPGKEEHPSLQSAIEEGYVRMDQLVGKFMKDFPDSRLILLTALSQQPWRETTKCTFRPRHFDEFLQFCGVDRKDVQVKPVMAEEFHVLCPSPEARDRVRQKILALTVDDQPVMKARDEDLNLFCGCLLNDTAALESFVEHPDGRRVAFADLFNMVHSMRSGRHHPHGMFWLQSDQPRVEQTPVPLVNVAPTLLELFDLAAPGYMEGHSVLVPDARPV